MAKPDDNKHLDKFSERLRKIYYNPEDAGSYGGIDRLYRRAVESGLEGIKRHDVLNFLRDQRSYSLHKPARRSFVRNKTVVKGIDVQWQADLADMQGLSRQNAGINYLLTCIDVFSKYAWVVPIKDKSSGETVKAFKKLFKDSSPRKPERLQTDRGKEFLNKEVKDYMKNQGIELFQTHSDKKAAVVERFNRTIKTRIWTYFSAKNTKRYLDMLPSLVTAYNTSKHRSIGMAPAEVRKEHEDAIWLRLYGDSMNRLPPTKMTPGQMVRIPQVKGDFVKGYMPNWTEQHYRLEGTEGRKRRVYKLQNIRGEPIEGSFYEQEVQPIGKNEHRVEQILKRRTLADGTREVFIKWKGWPAKYNTWVRQDESGRPLPGSMPQ
jgi:hypothetical protein